MENYKVLRKRKDTVSLHIVQCGLNIGKLMWELFASETGLTMDATTDNLSENEALDCSPFFTHRHSCHMVPRTVLVDFDADSVAKLQTGGDKCFILNNIEDLNIRNFEN